MKETLKEKQIYDYKREPICTAGIAKAVLKGESHPNLLYKGINVTYTNKSIMQSLSYLNNKLKKEYIIRTDRTLLYLEDVLFYFKNVRKGDIPSPVSIEPNPYGWSVWDSDDEANHLKVESPFISFFTTWNKLVERHLSVHAYMNTHGDVSDQFQYFSRLMGLSFLRNDTWIDVKTLDIDGLSRPVQVFDLDTLRQHIWNAYINAHGIAIIYNQNSLYVFYDPLYNGNTMTLSLHTSTPNDLENLMYIITYAAYGVR